MEQKTETKSGIKPGWQSTEFWITIGSILLGILVLTGVLTPAQSAANMVIVERIAASLMVILPQLGYSISRGKVKSLDVLNK